MCFLEARSIVERSDREGSFLLLVRLCKPSILTKRSMETSTTVTKISFMLKLFLVVPSAVASRALQVQASF